MFSHRLINDGSLRRTPDGFTFEIRLNWYRALPLSSLAILDVTLDGEAVNASDVRVEINGRIRTLAEAAEVIDEYWYVLDPAVVHVTGHHPGPGDHEIHVRLGSRAPYIIIGPGIDDVFTVIDECTRTLAA